MDKQKADAFKFISQIVANIPATKAQHEQMQAALAILVSKDNSQEEE